MQELVSSHVKMSLDFYKVLKVAHQTTNGKKMHFYCEVLNNSNLTHLKMKKMQELVFVALTKGQFLLRF